VGDAPLHVDLIARRSGISAAEMVIHLPALEYKGAVRQLAGKWLVRA
jgi:predicted Rossmann fold nucleotide-binding protein DprA/Smf involved in DNA uptake